MTRPLHITLAVVVVLASACDNQTPAVTPGPPEAPTPSPEAPTPPPEEPEEDGVTTADVVIGFVREKLEIAEGDYGELEVFVHSNGARPLRAELVAHIDYLTASQGDVLLSERIPIRLGEEEPSITWLAMSALPDDTVEGIENLVVRLALEGHGSNVVDFTNDELEVTILDGSDFCSGIQIYGTSPRKILDNPDVCGVAVFETNITVEFDEMAPVDMDFLTARTETGGNAEGEYSDTVPDTAPAEWHATNDSRVKHRFLMHWQPYLTGWEMRVQPCPNENRGPVLVCTVTSCRVYDPGTHVPLSHPPPPAKGCPTR